MACNAILNQSAFISEEGLLKALTPEIIKKVIPSLLKTLGYTAVLDYDYGSIIQFSIRKDGKLSQTLSINLRNGRISTPLDLDPNQVIALLKPVARQVIALKVKQAVTKMGGKVVSSESKEKYSQLRVKVG